MTSAQLLRGHWITFYCWNWPSPKKSNAHIHLSMATGRIWSERSSRWGWIMLKLSINHQIHRDQKPWPSCQHGRGQRSQMKQHDMPCILTGTLRPHSCGVCRCKGCQDAWDRMGWGGCKVVQPIIGRATWPTCWCEVHSMLMCRICVPKAPVTTETDLSSLWDHGWSWHNKQGKSVPEASSSAKGSQRGRGTKSIQQSSAKRFPVGKGSWRCWKVCSLHYPWNHHGITFFAEVKWCIFVWTFPLHKLCIVPAVKAAAALRRQWGSLLLYAQLVLVLFQIAVFFHPFTMRMLRSEIVGSGGRQTEKNGCKKGVHKPPLLRCHSRKLIAWYYINFYEMSWNVWKHHEMKYEKSMEISQFTSTLGPPKKTTEWVGAVGLESWFLSWRPYQTPITKDNFPVPSFFRHLIAL